MVENSGLLHEQKVAEKDLEKWTRIFGSIQKGNVRTSHHALEECSGLQEWVTDSIVQNIELLEAWRTPRKG
jgi:hypothetical protein